MPNSIALKPTNARTRPRPSRTRVPLLAVALLSLALHAAAQTDTQPVNPLAGNPSPYLALHAEDPVHWQLWDATAFARATREGKLVLVSSGYFSCHWCHVMQRESFRDAHIAAALNRDFIPVKLDREVLPDVDAALLDFARRTRGQAGWPLQVAVTPEGYPLAATTYLPPQDFAAWLDALARRWKAEAQVLTETARAAAEASRATPPAAPVTRGAWVPALRASALAQADELQGGFGAQSRFPHAPQLLALLQAYAREPHAELGAFLRLTLRQMATQGLHDELGGGFFRYTTDPDWQTPHFEKLLAENALLARVYLRAAAVFAETEWLHTAQRTLDFILAGLRAPGGGYYTALSALDGAGVEGGYYLWSRDELRELAGSRWPWLERYWGLDRPAPFPAGHLPIPRLSPAQLAAQLQLPQAVVEAELHALYARLRERRAQRALPVDRQVTPGANGLLLAALAEASAQVRAHADRKRYARAAAELAAFIRQAFGADGWRVPAARGVATPVAATLADHAYLAEGLAARLALTPAATADRAFLQRLVERAWTRFYIDGQWRLGEDALLRWGGTELMLADTALPAPPAVLMAVTRRLELPGLPVQPALDVVLPWVERQPFGFASYVGLVGG